MKIRSFIYLCAACFSFNSLVASTIDQSGDVDQKDINALREWINTKRQVTVRELGGALSIAGEVRTELQSSSETVDGIQQRNNSAVLANADGFGIPQNQFDIEVNIMMDYRTDRSWASIKLEFDNDAGIFSGTFNKLKVERAYWGVRVLDGDTYTFDIELGRRRLSMILDSKLEFNSFFDGAWFRYDQGLDAIADIYLHAGVFVINDARNQFGYVGEIGLMNIANTGFYTKYSLIDWDTKDLHNKIDNERFDFLVSQLIIGYRFLPKRLQKIVQIYAGGLWNSSARKLAITRHKRANFGGYIGVSIGEIKKKGDWAFDINYQVLAAQCVPDFDTQGIGLGNSANTGFYTSSNKGKSPTPNTFKTAGGNVNYRGFQATLDYLLLNQLDIQQSWQQSITLDNRIGKHRRYKQYEIEFIYGF